MLSVFVEHRTINECGITQLGEAPIIQAENGQQRCTCIAGMAMKRRTNRPIPFIAPGPTLSVL